MRGIVNVLPANFCFFDIHFSLVMMSGCIEIFLLKVIMRKWCEKRRKKLMKMSEVRAKGL